MSEIVEKLTEFLVKANLGDSSKIMAIENGLMFYVEELGFVVIKIDCDQNKRLRLLD